MRIVIEVVRGTAAGKRQWRRERGSMTIGRSEYADFVVTDDVQLSGMHFELQFDARECRIRDLGSSNGTQVNNKSIDQTVLRDGDLIVAGSTLFKVSIEGLAQIKDLPPAPVAAASAIADDDQREQQKIVLPGQSPEGQHILSILLKRTYDLAPGRRCTRAEKDVKLNPADVFYDDPMNTSVQFESDFCPFKLRTDVVLIGKAYARPGGSTTEMIASLAVGNVQKDLLIVGDRRCNYRSGREPVITDPEPFESMELRYENAYGGVDIYSDPNLPYPYPRNHLGRGFIVKANKKTLNNLRLPNIEDPNDPLTPDRLSIGEYEQWTGQPMPQGFGWYSKYCQPRASLAGVMPADRATEQELRAMYAKAVPEEQRELYLNSQLPDMDFRYFNGASQGLTMEFLSGNEHLSTNNLSAEGSLAFQLPGDQPKLGLDIGSGIVEPEVVLQTVAIRMDDRQVDLVWRGAVPFPGPDWLPEMKKMELSIA